MCGGRGPGQVAEKESGEKKWFENKRLPGLTHKAPDTSQVWDFCIKLNPECWISVLSFFHAHARQFKKGICCCIGCQLFIDNFGEEEGGRK